MLRLTMCPGIVLFLACGEAERPANPPPPTPAAVTIAQFQTLRYLEGRWRGTQDGASSFYEGYRFIDDSTIQSMTYPDSAATVPSDRGVIALRLGAVFSRGDSAVWVVTAIDTTSVTFDPSKNAANSFTWTRASPGSWTATLSWKNSKGQTKERIYQMERM